MLALALGLGASVAWGSADFVAGVGCRRVAVLTALLVSQAAGLALLMPILGASGQAAPGSSSLAVAALAGLFNALALAALYRGLAGGRMGLVSPIAACDAAVPVAFGLFSGERPGTFVLVGIIIAFVGVVLVSRAPEGPDGDVETARDSRAKSVAFGLAAALCFGGFMVALGGASEPNTLWAVVVARFTTVLLLTIVVVALRPHRRAPRVATARVVERAGAIATLGINRVMTSALLGAALLLHASRASEKPWRGPLVAVGALDVGASALFAAATTVGLLSVVGMLSSFYPVVTIVLARVFLGERLGRLQQAGAAAAVVGGALMASAT